jgi:hypothetical protein
VVAIVTPGGGQVARRRPREGLAGAPPPAGAGAHASRSSAFQAQQRSSGCSRTYGRGAAIRPNKLLPYLRGTMTVADLEPSLPALSVALTSIV